ncbi:MAG: YgjP-like metallopeptidase domain-containing protein [Treponema sp.]
MKLAENLKKAVLQAAMQGKLTRQLKTDSSVDELLQKNAEEKARLIAEGKIKKEKPLAKITEEEIPFEIPENWRWVKLGNLVSLPVKRGKAPKYATKSSVLVFAQKCNQKYGSISMEKALYLNEDLLKRYTEEDFIKANDIVINSTGGGTMGRVGFVEPTVVDIPEKIVPDTHVTLVRANTNLVLEKYLYIFCKSMQPVMESLGVGSTNQTELRPEIISNLNVPLPPIEEQQRIVEKLNSILPVIDEYGKEEDELVALSQNFPEDIKKSVLQSAMQGKLTRQLKTDSSVDELLQKNAEEKARLIAEGKIKKEKPLAKITEEEIPFEIPENWRWVKLGNLVSLPVKRGKAPKYATKSSVLVFAQKCNQKYGSISMEKALYLNEDLLKRYTEEDFIKANDIVINSTGGGTMGRVGFVEPTVVDIPEKIVPDTHVTLVRANTNLVLEKYLYIFCKSMQPVMESLGVGSTNQTELRPEIISNLNVPLPPIEEQQRIVEKLNQILPVIDSMAVYGTKKKAGRPKQEEALSFIRTFLQAKKTAQPKTAAPEILALKTKAKQELPAAVKKYAGLMGVTYNRITIRHQKTRWGSCTKTGNLNFNCLIMEMPDQVRDYVIIHELAHRKELNHSSKYWTIVAKYCPWYKEAKQWLKDNGQELMER